MDISIILVKPLYEGNVGSTARAMANFGFKNLVLVKPCKIGKKAEDMAVHAKGILKSAKKFKGITHNQKQLCVSQNRENFFSTTFSRSRACN